MSKSTTDALQRIDADADTIKRAQWEAFEFSADAGIVTVRNGSHDDPDEHEYLVVVENGRPVACGCKAFEYRPGACKHMAAVAMREPVLDAAIVGEGGPDRTDPDEGAAAVVTDGGEIVVAGDEGEILDEDERPEDCDCSTADFNVSLPCFACYREGFETPNPKAGEEA